MESVAQPNLTTHTAESMPQALSTRALILQCRELARSRLSGMLSEALDRLADDLFTLAEASASRAEQQVLFDAMAHVRQYRDVLRTGFSATSSKFSTGV